MSTRPLRERVSYVLLWAQVRERTRRHCCSGVMIEGVYRLRSTTIPSPKGCYEGRFTTKHREEKVSRAKHRDEEGVNM